MDRRHHYERPLWPYLRWGGMLIFLGVPMLVWAEVRGTVINGTTGKPAADVEVHLVVLEEGMQVAERTRTDAQGRFAFSTAVTKPAMVRVTHQGVNYHEMLSPGSASVTLRIYEARERGAYAVERLTYLVQPVQGRLLVGREYLVRNQTKPPVTLFRPEGMFAFALPGDARPERVSVIGESGMPLAIAARPAGDGTWRIEHPLRPGTTPFFVVTQLPYEEERAQIREVLPWNVERVRLLVPEPMKVEAPGFRPLGSEQGLSVYVLDDARAGMELAVSVSGRAPNVLAEESEGGTRGSVRAVAGPIAKWQWIILAALAVAFATSGVLAARRQKGRAMRAKEEPAGAPSRVPHRMDALKEELFVLELQRQRGEISEADYEAKRRALQHALEAALRADAETSA